MKLSDLGEFGLIDKIRKSSAPPSPSVLVGIGDDAAVVNMRASTSLLATTDMLIEGVHFDLSFTDFYSLGWKSAAVNLSDIAAMGGSPRFCLTSLGIPPFFSVKQIAGFYRGLTALLTAHRTALVGGDTCSSPQGMTVSVTLLGEIEKKFVVGRGGAKPGDRIFVTGTLGDSSAGLELLKAGASGRQFGVRSSETGVRNRKTGVRNRDVFSELRTPYSELVKRHLRPVPRVEWGRALARSRCAHAMIDVSDGLSSDLSHICEQSGVGAVVEAGKIPLSPQLRKIAAHLSKTPVRYALDGGEDYELLFTVPPEKTKKLRSLGLPATEIGEITRTRKMLMADERGGTISLRPTGFNHFA
ncbi:MAG TPA: thiamine-phosphate kinase [Nitrospirota bacterium]|nr:thiamine-phosphate kinase [Nitrospirota bacterium]